MAYTELTCDDEGLGLETLYRMSLIDNGDGTYSQRVIDGTALLGDDFNNDFNDDFNI